LFRTDITSRWEPPVNWDAAGLAMTVAFSIPGYGTHLL
jgi:hypothetical protein